MGGHLCSNWAAFLVIEMARDSINCILDVHQTGAVIHFQSQDIAIAAVAMRSYDNLDSVTMGDCLHDEVYNQHTDR